MTAPAMNAMAAMGGIVGTLRDVAVSPVRRWSQASTMHKVLSIAAGVGTAYYLHKQGLADAPVALGGLAAAWGLSAVMHYPAIAQASPGVAAVPGVNAVAALPAPVEQMAQQAEAAMGLGQYQAQATVPTGALAPVQPQGRAPAQAAPMAPPPAPTRGGSSKWAILDQ